MAEILVVDDHPDSCRVLAKIISSLAAPALCVESGSAALRLVEQEMPKLVFLDWMMPDMNGLDVLRALRANPRTAELPVVIYSAVSDAAVRTAALNAGAQDFVVKGSFQDVLSAVTKYLN